jgi:hypothetical protein
MKYKEYLITEFVNDKGQWQAHIPRRGRQTHERGGNDTSPIHHHARRHGKRGNQNCKRGNRYAKDFSGQGLNRTLRSLRRSSKWLLSGESGGGSCRRRSI